MWFKKRSILTYFVLALFVYLSMRLTEFDLSKFKDFRNMIDFLSHWFPMDFSLLPKILEDSLETLAMAFLGSFFGLIIGLPLSFMAAKNTSGSKLIYHLTRVSLSFVRSIPEIVFGLILLTALGLGPFPAVLAIMFHNIGVLGKLISELIEASDPGPQEAMKAVGAKSWFASLFSILPQIWPNVLSNYFYRFEVAIRTSLILGFIGGGGIGQRLFNDFKTFQYSSVSLDVLVIMIIVVLVDLFGSYVRNRVI
ncbi:MULTISPECIES: phosphonate ABC transporter, permease protein PhnE [Cytobacillus]|uniref:Phosphonate ABC transporter, permease protein PhnE n=1 Tax=Cytobacillus pseudoceanisediminis TaxID=3051614 RepID=A0ABZ2ZSZ2_9BACI|nr:MULTISPECIES: phosphonate ABC transporter, permease protein PhnE [Cytobacillus]MCM3404505.1 phosphonate ABC transporter, permease protein PhnE [Cytobacillus oceanisediminis]MCS0789344.1 phosphonate ABC transporter, permease protein PhnE [Cytobacillus firmus]MDK7668000.1 phosphonate ABC transporter, permease protein PhnE [Cytobacillus oceanisediminis]QOK28467.1 phosphonate ABC transporter, permease protein PhnE [Cytobacillus oceanisediminis]